MIHSLLRNEVYLHFECPRDWKIEHAIEVEQKSLTTFQVQVQGLKQNNRRKVIADAAFNRNGYLHLIEVDNSRDMKDNRKKVDMYREILPSIQDGVPILFFFTTTEDRKRKLGSWLKGIRHQVKTFAEIK
ncbi:hypothetical protein CVD25_01175 [Bacillus canaveralius]|uniref:Uncharacterized protein n=2 Tax=Bacillus canaveralius TaxID=1403243 RepID=A0A2N5GPP0_9BACI|nr:hypothetical protein CU635_06285 [Bacillus canaveralius]PLS00828.1 hypothetical protein CVD25_01175 [Bacillus canaveralius]